jgi:hypothetical protein
MSAASIVLRLLVLGATILVAVRAAVVRLRRVDA